MAFKTLADTDSVQTLTNKTLGTGTVISAGSIPSPVFSGTVTGTYTLGGTPTGSLIQTLSTGSTTARSLASQGADVLNVLDYGADKTGVADSTAALQAVALVCDGKAVWFPSGTYKVTDTVVWAAQHTSLFGNGPHTTLINFQPTASGKACFKFAAVNPPYNIQVFCGIQNMKFSSVGNTQNGKVAVQIVTNEEFWMDNFRIEAFTSAAEDCVGIEHFGWQLNHFCNGHVYANLPISLRLNPWTLTIFLDLDDCYFESLILAPRNGDNTATSTTNPAVKIEDGAFVTNSSFRNCHWIGGAHGVQWDDISRTITGIADNGGGKCRVTTSAAHTFDNGRTVLVAGVVGTVEANVRAVATSVDATHFDLLTVPFVHTYTSGGIAYRSPGNSYCLIFDNCRGESQTSTTYDYKFDRQGSPIENVEWRSVYFSASHHGVYARKVKRQTYHNCIFPASTKESVNSVAEIQSSVDFDNCQFSTSGALAKLSGYRLTSGGAKPASASNIPGTAHYDADTQDSSSHTLLADNVGHRAFAITLVDDEVYNLRCGSSEGQTFAIIQFIAVGATAKAAGTVFSDTAVAVYSSAFTDVGTLCSTSTNVRLSDSDTFFCVYRNSGTTQLKNRLGETVQVLVTLDHRASSDITATNLSTIETYTVGAAQNFTDIVITDAVSAYVTARVITTSAQGGRLNTATAGATTSTYDNGIPNGQGTWYADGTVADVNTLLSGLTWTPHDNIAVTGCANNGGGKVRVTMPGHGYTGTQTFTITGVTGTVEANITKVSCTFVDADKYDILSVNFVSAYTGGGTVFYAGTLAVSVIIHNAKNQIVQGRKSLTPV